MRKALLGLLAVSLILAADAPARVPTGSVGGTVFERNGNPAAGAEVMLERSDGSAPVAVKANSNGRYLFKFVLAGYYDIRASRGTSATTWKHNVMVRVGKETAIDLRLEPASPKPAK
jgi:hypothetical protein